MVHFFQPTTDNRLYCSKKSNISDSANNVYYLLKSTPEQPYTQIDSVDAWENKQYDGWYLFTSKSIKDIGQFADTISAYLKDASNKDTRFMWIPFPDGEIEKDNCIIKVKNSYLTPVTCATNLTLRNVTLYIGENNSITFDDNSGSCIITNESNTIGLKISPSEELVLSKDNTNLSLSLFSETAGTISCEFFLLRKWIQKLGCDLRYFSVSQESHQLIIQRFPVFNLPTFDTRLNLNLNFSPFDSFLNSMEWTSGMTFMADSCIPFQSFFRTITDKHIDIVPIVNKSGFRFAPSPTEMPCPSNSDAYLTLNGCYKLSVIDKEFDLLCGLSGIEKIRLQRDTSTIHFEPFSPAFVNKNDITGYENEINTGSLYHNLDGHCTTAWIGFSQDTEDGDQLPDKEKLGYYAQADMSPFYSSTPVTGPDQPLSMMIMDARVSPLVTSSKLPSVPMVPYAGIDSIDDNTQQSINKDIPLSSFMSLECEVLIPARKALMPFNKNGPEFFPCNYSSTNHISKVTQARKTQSEEIQALTPQGLLVLINKDEGGNEGGHWVELILSRSNLSSPSSPYLSFTAAQQPESGPRAPLDPLFVDAMMANQLFLVITDPAHTGRFNSVISIGNFTFDLAPGDRDGTPGTVLIFKFHQQSLQELAGDVKYWSRPGDFNGDLQRANGISLFLKSYIDNAIKGKNPDLEGFCHCVTDKNWNGIIALNTSVDVTRMPDEIIGLMAGMEVPLRGHHVLIGINHLSTTGTIEQDSTSLSGFIQYPLQVPNYFEVPTKRIDEPLPFDYKIKNLEVSFKNGSAANFRCGINLITQKLFGREMVLGKADGGHTNELFLKGTFETHEGKNVLSFENPDYSKTFFVNPPDVPFRVIERIHILNAVFSIVKTSDTLQGERTIHARFSLEGGISFTSDIHGMDLLGYGGKTVDDALPFSDLYFDVDFVIDNEGRYKDKKVVFNPENIKFDHIGKSDNRTPVRKGSLPSSLPFELNGFKCDMNGLSSNKMGGKQVYIKFPPPAAPVDHPEDFTTPAPHYAIDFILPLGTLGSLSSIHVAFDAHITVGWGPSPIMKDLDAVGMTVQLPELTPGFKGMSLQGVLKTTFGTANLLYMPFTKNNEQSMLYALAFNNVQLSLFGIGLPPGIMLDLFLFSDVSSGTNNLGWLVVYSHEKKNPGVIMRDIESGRRIPYASPEQAVRVLIKSKTPAVKGRSG
jgi:hypothetical protein